MQLLPTLRTALALLCFLMLPPAYACTDCYVMREAATKRKEQCRS